MSAWRTTTLWLLIGLAAQPAPAITISIDYRFDTSGFFDTRTTQGAKATATLQAAANFYNSILTDSFSAITPPASYTSTATGSTGVASWNWTEQFSNPSNPASQIVLTNPPVGTGDFIIYAGARSLAGVTAGEGGVGKVTHPDLVITGTNIFTSADQAIMSKRQSDFDTLIGLRGQPAGEFARWGGTVSFDNDGTTPWFFDYPSAVPSTKVDFYSVALHELGHTLGFGEQTTPATTAWQSKLSGSTFIGANVKALNGGNPVLLDTTLELPTLSHWAQNQMSVVYGTTTSQEVVMDPNGTVGQRKKLTALDLAALKDIGWSVAVAPFGDFSNNRIVDAADYPLYRKNLNRSVTLANDPTPGTVTTADYNTWRQFFGIATTTVPGSESPFDTAAAVPEPSTAMLMLLIGVAASIARWRL